MNQYYPLVDKPIHSLDKSLRARLMSAEVQLMQKALSTPIENLKDCTMRAVANSLDRCIKDSGYIYELESEGFNAYKMLKIYARAILRGVIVLFASYSDNKYEDNAIKERFIEELRKDNKMDVLDFKLASHVFDKFAVSKGFRTRKSIIEYAHDLRIGLDHLLSEREATSDLKDVRDFFVFLDKYESSPSFRLTCW